MPPCALVAALRRSAVIPSENWSRLESSCTVNPSAPPAFVTAMRTSIGLLGRARSRAVGSGVWPVEIGRQVRGGSNLDELQTVEGSDRTGWDPFLQ
jgi:hypothetical protein